MKGLFVMGKLVSVLMFVCMVCSGIASAWFYSAGDISKACFWLILCGVAVILYSRDNAALEFHYRECNFFYGNMDNGNGKDNDQCR